MTAVRLTFDVSDPSGLVDDGWNQIKIERDTGSGFTELSRSTTRIPLRDVVETYVYSDPNWVSGYSYRAIIYDSVDVEDHPTPIVITDITEMTYVTVAEIREEGVTVSDASDARVAQAIDWTNRYIERYTKRKFGTRFGIKKYDVQGLSDGIILEEPLIALLDATVGATAIDETTLEVYNRHLRGGPDEDLGGPQIRISDDLDTDRYYSIWLNGAAFDAGTQNLVLSGIWGYTEPTMGAIGGETADDSQVPLDYGQIPDLINWAARALTLNRIFPMYSEDAELAARRKQLIELRTRDQMVKFNDEGSSMLSTGWAADDAIHEVLSGYARSITFGSV